MFSETRYAMNGDLRVAQRYLKTSIVITTNRGVGAWGEILGDTTVAAAMLDRL